MKTANLVILRFNKDESNLVQTVIDLFNIDEDYCTNTEMFRSDTLSLGFETESKRCAVEICDVHKDKKGLLKFESIVKDAINNTNGESHFIIGNKTYCQSYIMETVVTDSECIIVISYIF